MGRQLLVLVSYIPNGIYGSKFYISMKIVFFCKSTIHCKHKYIGFTPPTQDAMVTKEYIFRQPLLYIPAPMVFGDLFQPNNPRISSEIPFGMGP